MPEKFGFYAKALPEKLDLFYVSGVRVAEIDADGIEQCEQCPDDRAEFWSVYAVDSNGLSSCVADLPSSDLAHQLCGMLVALRIDEHIRAMRAAAAAAIRTGAGPVH